MSDFRDTVVSVSAIVSVHARPGTPLAITEANIAYDYLVGSYTPATRVAAPTTFYAGMWTADVLGAALESNLWTMAFWGHRGSLHRALRPRVLAGRPAAQSLTIAVDTLATQSLAFPARSVTLLQIPDAAGALPHVVQYTQAEADAGAGPVTIQ